MHADLIAAAQSLLAELGTFMGEKTVRLHRVSSDWFVARIVRSGWTIKPSLKMTLFGVGTSSKSSPLINRLPGNRALETRDVIRSMYAQLHNIQKNS